MALDEARDREAAGQVDDPRLRPDPPPDLTVIARSRSSGAGSGADWLRRLAEGIDDRPVEPNSEPKSAGSENTFASDLTDLNDIRAAIDEMQAAIKAGKITCVQIVRHYLARVRAYNGVASALVEMAASGELYTLLMAYSEEFVDRDLLRAGANPNIADHDANMAALYAAIDMRRLAVGQVVYTAMCYEHGGMIDDGTVFRLGPHNFRWIGGDEFGGKWLRDLAAERNLNVWVKSSTDQLHNIAVQGPKSREILADVIWTPPSQPRVNEIAWFHFTIGRVGDFHGAPVLVSRTGYSGELGYELHFPSPAGEHLWDALVAAGSPSQQNQMTFFVTSVGSGNGANLGGIAGAAGTLLGLLAALGLGYYFFGAVAAISLAPVAGILAASWGLTFESAPRTSTDTSGSESTRLRPADSNNERCAVRADVRTTARNARDDTTPVTAGWSTERTLTRLGR